MSATKQLLEPPENLQNAGIGIHVIVPLDDLDWPTRYEALGWPLNQQIIRFAKPRDRERL
ncbi:predicted protein [Coccidioides posadasii str. Silveira]|uniref:Predicted protein n=1 Tax=Coccidioides posadasii (strain RMSCC 757 / Silveira) TaxID=443226 RepID=E9DA78_COCPS|nr:predicted protein [Coccidioides posadasii str. Silveira]